MTWRVGTSGTFSKRTSVEKKECGFRCQIATSPDPCRTGGDQAGQFLCGGLVMSPSYRSGFPRAGLVYERPHFQLLLFLIISFFLFSRTTLAQSPQAKEAGLSLARLSASFEALAQQVSPAVVQIFVTAFSALGVEGESSGASVLARQQSTGSGVILDPHGYIVTCAHVVENARRVQILLPTPRQTGSPGQSLLKNRGRILDGQVLGVDRESDLAVVKIAEKDLPYVELADSDELKQGQLVLAFGAPLGLPNSLTMGVVSGVGRQLKAEDPMVYIQTDTPINPGNSGGAAHRQQRPRHGNQHLHSLSVGRK
jgi:serine protease Do